MIRLFACPESNKGMHHEGNFGGLIKVIWHDGQGACLEARARAVHLAIAADGTVVITPAQLGYLSGPGSARR